MNIEQKFLIIGKGKQQRKISILHRAGKKLGLFWLGGFKSDMMGTKALALDELGQELNLEVTRFDYSGHGQSEGEFIDGTITNWLEESRQVFAQTKNAQIIIGSSMGGWLALLLNRLLDKEKKRIKAIILIAPAIDMTKDLMFENFSLQQKDELTKNGFILQPSDYDEPYLITKKLIDDGNKHLLFNSGSINTNCPIYILQGGLDKAVPPTHSLKLMAHLTQDEVNYTLIPDGDHSLSREQDLKKLERIIKEIF